ncbi:LPD29 domain-containing protein [Burkholderia gladioli]|uniref:LPD29 domain-containing protein n=1 Tax=Burkholderia gladioli TaxID=28095 RepID=UPI00163DFB82|nr:LPD29 domain-containing protein [Burkholderia gladioli]
MLTRTAPAAVPRISKEPASSAVQTRLALVTVMTLIDTAQLVQTILREAFPATAFAVSIHTTGGATLLDVAWTDGPRADQVARFVHPLQARRVGADGRACLVEHFTLTSKGCQTVQLAADRISLTRGFSDASIGAALEVLEARYRDRLAPDHRTLLTVGAYRAGALRGVELEGIHRIGATRVGACLQCDIDTRLADSTDVVGFPRSPTAAALFVRRDMH